MRHDVIIGADFAQAQKCPRQERRNAVLKNIQTKPKYYAIHLRMQKQDFVCCWTPVVHFKSINVEYHIFSHKNEK